MISIPKPVMSIASAYPLVCTASSNEVGLYNFTQKNSAPPLYSNIISQRNVFVMSKSERLFFCFVARNALLLDDNLNSNYESITLDESSFEHAQTPLLFASLFSNGVNIYDFKTHHGLAHIQNGLHLCSFQQTFIVSSESSLYYLVDFSESYELFLLGSSENAIKKVRPFNFESLCSFF